MFAVIKTGAASNTGSPPTRPLRVEKLPGEPGDAVSFPDVLMLGGEEPKIGSPFVAGASVHAEIVEQGRGKRSSS